MLLYWNKQMADMKITQLAIEYSWNEGELAERWLNFLAKYISNYELLVKLRCSDYQYIRWYSYSKKHYKKKQIAQEEYIKCVC